MGEVLFLASVWRGNMRDVEISKIVYADSSRQNSSEDCLLEPLL
jgi:hypothetical protein